MRHRIAVVGGGPAGLTLARVLHRHDHPVAVLERDPAPDARPPGGTLDLHEGLGQLALDKAGLLAEFQALSRPEGQAMRILDPDGTVLRDWQPRPDDRANPEIDRGQLRDLLLGPLDVQWGRGVTQVVPGTPDGVLVHFADGRQETFDLVVGADGAWSRIRPAVSSATPHYTGVTSVETSLDDADTRHPDLARMVGDGSVAVYGANRALVAQRNSGGHIKVYAQFRAELDWHTDLDLADVEAVRSSLLALFDGWAAPVLDLLRHGTAFVHRPLHVLPVSHTWPHVPGVTLLGDAAHLMPPLGAGANLAMLEGAELAESIATGPGDLDEAVRAFEERMWARAGRWAKITTAGLERLVSPDPAAAIALFDEVQPS
ncbi:FAD-dependent oxidoreductase [Streptomyces rapamycinicus]|uniref:Flavin-dependent monooxygenase n=2 Tax=Streptomyces rapamycinicus TaxID=1226757 RepID=A0A0A0N3L1_STRRN|nr:NAD(P)/FAD-dependent oxidoreductase [Streptomyces rapamycinicus]AGP52402.1 monooxygenase [Streptomyces rapamycinicus NRRL 5491]MBB4779870.1 2-polyprenyl-6-methoxyphenol hydroxylase-like FAD-dependent oxidoreductase [Streptomyces rapamycinicus]RLV75475.1 FAD-dependent oxidoreductase [Streptomyces rapamycinicus NRRL 5491]UTP28582.1 FAD-dependent monooxygenase [Streptomyces rapamycinicus NRRL 5491]